MFERVIAFLRLLFGGVEDYRLFSVAPEAGMKKVAFRTRGGDRLVAKVVARRLDGRYILRRPGHKLTFFRSAREVFSR